MRMDLTRQQVAAVVSMMEVHFPEDERLLLDTLEGETDLFELCAKLLGDIEKAEGDIAALKTQMDDRKVRKDRAEARKDASREAIAALMEIARQDKIVLPEATLSLRDGNDKVDVVDAKAVPDEYCKLVPDNTAIKDAFPPDADLPNWLVKVEAGKVLTVRRK